ncbi:orotidine-5'-phosphate decarboxylase [Rhodobium orientis]|uniref:Orotidine 5'-phosphate decarboxylase n=1 Tax=Rhodobium orientis TaxID=34017 RepID=A0A327JV66_9HYPH|nr:orotidine-5'-phosphate decarboxylase [Rhodobium orientis]MBB4304326.1 orotidine-5'-phosphate decarboxylase [Rhodobium orientis]MBK5948180.1 orotidine-5'-phosphate decarboxylase [Rhodobium orientis]RAI28822.1 orotidine-5'-phosphate decarboxylase [Rhodobium orientis]
MTLRPETATDRLMVALDVPTVAEARTIVEETRGAVGVYKIGMQLQFAGGLAFARELAGEGQKIFLDVKLLDIDNTIGKAVENIVKMGVSFVTIHAYPKAMRAAVAARGDAPLALLGVTVLTSMDDGDLVEAGYAEGVADLVGHRALDARTAGMAGVICSPREAKALRGKVGDDLLLVTPGIRPAGADIGDQKRIMTPADAIRAGADYLVVGRPVVGATDRRAAAEAIVAEIEGALGG